MSHKKPRPMVAVDMSMAASERRDRKIRERMLARSAARICELERLRQGNN